MRYQETENMRKKEKVKKEKRPLGLGSWIILLICAIVFVGCLGKLGLYVKDNLDAQNQFKDLKSSKGVDLEDLYAMNSDFVGWLTVEGTKIDYPVMHTPEDPEYYIHRDFYEAYSEAGTPFLDGESVISGADRTWNWMIYGHNMKFGTMFHDLLDYEDSSFWKEHKTFTFDTYTPEQGESKGTYEVVAAARSKIRTEDSQAFKYYQYSGRTDEASFDEFVRGVKAESIYDTGVTPEYGDQLVTLSTCAYHTDNGRFYVVGRKVD